MNICWIFAESDRAAAALEERLLLGKEHGLFLQEPVHHSVYKVQSTLDNIKMDKIPFLSPEGIEPLLDSPPTEPQLLMSVTEVPMWMREEL